MKKSPCVTLLTILLISTVTFIVSPGLRAASCGTSCGGGGSIVEVTPDSPPELLDLYSLSGVRFAKSTPESVVEITPLGTKAGFQPIDVLQDPAFALALNRLSLWQENSPTVVSVIQRSLESLMLSGSIESGVPYSATPSRFKVMQTYDLPSGFIKRHPRAQVQMAILFMPQYGSIISLPVWNRLDEETRAGLLIHEAIRQIQMTYGLGLTNLQIQLLTANIVAQTPPDKAGALETKALIGPILFNHIAQKKDDQAVVEKFRQTACRQLPAWEALSRPNSEASVASCSTPFEQDVVTDHLRHTLKIMEKLASDNQDLRKQSSKVMRFVPMDPQFFANDEVTATGIQEVWKQLCDPKIEPYAAGMDMLEIELTRCLTAPYLGVRHRNFCETMYANYPWQAILGEIQSATFWNHQKVTDIRRGDASSSVQQAVEFLSANSHYSGQPLDELIRGMTPEEKGRYQSGLTALSDFRQDLVDHEILEK